MITEALRASSYKYLNGNSSLFCYQNCIKFQLHFIGQVLKFFKECIAQQYPEVNTESDHYQEAKYRHEAFMRSRSEVVLGREDILEEV